MFITMYIHAGNIVVHFENTNLFFRQQGQVVGLVLSPSSCPFFVARIMTNPITQIRLLKGITRSEFCRQAGLSYPTASIIEGGLVDSLSQKSAAKIADYAGLQAREVMESYRDFRESLKK